MLYYKHIGIKFCVSNRHIFNNNIKNLFQKYDDAKYFKLNRDK